MSSLIPGVHVAMHTRAEILHTAAWMDSPTTCGRSFKQGAWSRRAAFGTLPSLSGLDTMSRRTPSNFWHCRGWPRALPVSNSSHPMSAGFSTDWPCVVTLSRCRSSMSCGGHGRWATALGGNRGLAAVEWCAPTITYEWEQPPASWAPWRLRRLGSLGHADCPKVNPDDRVAKGSGSQGVAIVAGASNH